MAYSEAHDFSRLLFKNVNVRIEKLGSQHYWIGIERPGTGTQASVNFWIETDLQIRSRFTEVKPDADDPPQYGILP